MIKTSSDLLEQILIHGPSPSTVFLVLKEMQAEGRTQAVIQGSLKALDIYPDCIELKNLLTESYLEAGFFGLAEAELIEVTKKIDELAGAYKLQARIYAGQKRMDEARDALKIFLSHNPNDTEGLDLLAQITPVEPEAAPEEELLSEAAVEQVMETTAVIDQTEAEPEIEPEEEPIEDEFGIEPIPEAAEAEPEIESPISEQEVKPPEEEHPPAQVQSVQSEAIEEQPEKEVVDLATPTLAELYAGQGQILEAISTYEKVLLNDPDDKASEQRLEELKAATSEVPGPVPSEKDTIRKRTEKNIRILETWRNKIQAMRNG